MNQRVSVHANDVWSKARQLNGHLVQNHQNPTPLPLYSSGKASSTIQTLVSLPPSPKPLIISNLLPALREFTLVAALDEED